MWMFQKTITDRQKRTDVDDSERLRGQNRQLAAVEPQAALPTQRAI